jgi:hypothetical protein
MRDGVQSQGWDNIGTNPTPEMSQHHQQEVPVLQPTLDHQQTFSAQKPFYSDLGLPQHQPPTAVVQVRGGAGRVARGARAEVIVARGVRAPLAGVAPGISPPRGGIQRVRGGLTRGGPRMPRRGGSGPRPRGRPRLPRGPPELGASIPGILIYIIIKELELISYVVG